MDPLLSSFLDLAEQSPEAPLVLGPGGTWRRGELAQRIVRLGGEWRAALAARGRGAGSVLALRVEPGPGFLVAYLACRAADACVLLIDGCLTQEEQAHISRELGASCQWSSSRALSEGSLAPDGVSWLSGHAELADTACLKLTSGSTGEPAGVRTSAEALMLDGQALVSCMQVTSDDKILASVPLSHSYGLSVIASPAWLVGSPVIFPNGADLLQVADEYGATVLPSIPSWYEAQLAATDASKVPATVRLCLSAGAPLLPRTAATWIDHYGQGVHVLYGSSECGGIAYDARGDAAVRGSVGTIMDGVSVELDQNARITVRTPKVALGYWPEGGARDLQLTQDRFQTEDLAHFDGPELILDGRHSDWINVKGKKVNPREVERVLREHPSIQDAAVFALRSEEGHGERVRAVIACDQGSLEFMDVMTWCKSRLAPHKYPRSIAFCLELPRTERGKLDRKALRQL